MPLLSDVDGTVRAAYGVAAGVLPGRVTYVIDREGIVRHVTAARLRFEGHVREAMTAVKELP